MTELLANYVTSFMGGVILQKLIVICLFRTFLVLHAIKSVIMLATSLHLQVF